MADDVDEGDTAEVEVTVDDPGTADTFTGTIDWGDGSEAASFERTAAADGSQSFTLTHRYLDDPAEGDTSRSTSR